MESQRNISLAVLAANSEEAESLKEQQIQKTLDSIQVCFIPKVKQQIRAKKKIPAPLIYIHSLRDLKVSGLIYPVLKNISQPELIAIRNTAL